MHTEQSILVIEDDQSTRMLIKSILGKQGYRLLEATDGQEGLEVFLRDSPDLVLMDVMMPRLDGFAACRAMRESEAVPGTPVIMLTAADATTDVERAFESGATDFITKPINWPLLASRLRYALRARRTSLELQRTRLRQSHAQKIARLGFWAWHTDSDCLEWSVDLAEMAGIAAAEVDHLDKLLTRVHPDDRTRLAQAMNVSRTALSRLDQEVRLPQAGGGMRVLHLVAEHSPTQGPARLFEGAWQDVTQTREAERMVQHLALHDTLTGLPNSKLFLRLLETAIEGARRAGYGIAMVLFDISRLGRINDALGMKVGDLVLARVAHALQQGMPSEVHAARLAGDEFALLVPHNDLSRLRAKTEAALARTSQPLDVDGQALFVSLTAGIALFPDHAGDAEEMIQAARDARKLARLQGRPLGIARPSDTDRGTELKLELALRTALEENFRQFHLVYQPQLQLRDNRIVGVEALIRWEHPEVGPVPPPRFIPIMEELGLINALGEWILRSACRQLRAWQNLGIQLQMSINLSPRQFQDNRLTEVLVAAVRDAGVPPTQIKLEITESIAMQDPQGTIEQLRGWRAQGFQIAIDDFGIGYSSLEYLLRFPLDTIKIDRAFIKDIVASPSDRAIVRAVTVMAQSMGLSTVAEGVETQRQQDYLDAIGISQIQGYLFGKPMRADDLARFYLTHQGRSTTTGAATRLAQAL
ncbi:EAL domain-containing protein [Pseudomonas sp. OF001]|uniref:putative bifunctional diguanylate cyclase/phosphodiesterase n=1 Tax=unclassified Pseudomonas TaxID=196821 RepID=UPI0010A6A16A|nr:MULTISPECIES: EAL domain-containing protein [unclassified Pseudomonas]THG82294.1 EAL domain-containing protein [Pseudomonas sp. A-1]WPP43783.1 EAL domain-containing protein [Pseudomonas sp. AN-1]CAD5379939.1 EAL domain-containing protein [Pseudomonas sp. OF001]